MGTFPHVDINVFMSQDSLAYYPTESPILCLLCIDTYNIY